MDIIKESRIISKSSGNYRCAIRTNTYASSFEHISMLASLAKKDYPNLTDNDIDVVYYDNDFYARTYGVHFTVSNPKKEYLGES